MAEGTDQMREKRGMAMSSSESSKAKDTSLTRDILFVARYYLGNRRVLLVFVAAVTGLAHNWNWLVAVGLAPVLLSTLPCLIMCVFGVCMMCRSGEQQLTLSQDANDRDAPFASPAAASQNAAGCCEEGPASDTNSIAGGRQSLNKTIEWR